MHTLHEHRTVVYMHANIHIGDHSSTAVVLRTVCCSTSNRDLYVTFHTGEVEQLLFCEQFVAAPVTEACMLKSILHLSCIV